MSNCIELSGGGELGGGGKQNEEESEGTFGGSRLRFSKWPEILHEGKCNQPHEQVAPFRSTTDPDAVYLLCQHHQLYHPDQHHGRHQLMVLSTWFIGRIVPRRSVETVCVSNIPK